MNKQKIESGDTVYHSPSGENWTVCGVNYFNDILIPCGYPFPSTERVCDCKLIKKGNGQTKEMKEALESVGYGHYK